MVVWTNWELNKWFYHELGTNIHRILSLITNAISNSLNSLKIWWIWFCFRFLLAAYRHSFRFPSRGCSPSKPVERKMSKNIITVKTRIAPSVTTHWVLMSSTSDKMGDRAQGRHPPCPWSPISWRCISIYHCRLDLFQKEPENNTSKFMYISSCQHIHLKFLVLGWPNEKYKFSGTSGLGVLF
jgi:hypothetical protein